MTDEYKRAYNEAVQFGVPFLWVDDPGGCFRPPTGQPRHDEVTFTAAEIGGQIVSALRAPHAMMTEEVQKLKVETALRLREV